MALKLVTPPSTDPITLAEAKAHLNVNFTNDDALIAKYIRAAHMSIVYDLGRTLSPATWDLVYDSWPTDNDPEGGIQIPMPPLISVESVNYIDPTTELEVPLAQSGYEVDTISDMGFVVPASTGWPLIFETINAVRIRFIAGYPDMDSPPVSGVPESLQQAVLLLVRDMYDFRGSLVPGVVTRIPEVVRRLTDPFQVYWI